MILNSLINCAYMTRPGTAEERDVMASSATFFAQPDAAALLAQAEYERFHRHLRAVTRQMLTSK